MKQRSGWCDCGFGLAFMSVASWVFGACYLMQRASASPASTAPAVIAASALGQNGTGTTPPPDPAAIYRTWLTSQNSINSNLFEEESRNNFTYLWKVGESIDQDGQYTGETDAGEPYTLDVIYFESQPLNDLAGVLEPQDYQRLQTLAPVTGFFQGKMSTASGTMYITGQAASWFVGVGEPGTAPDGRVNSFVITTKTSDLMDGLDDPAIPDDDFDPESIEPGPEFPGDCPTPMLCAQCANGGTWCPCESTDVWLAKQQYDNCMKAALAISTIEMHLAIALLILALEGCVLTGPFVLFCESAAFLTFLLTAVAIMAQLAIMHWNCWADYQAALQAAMMEACGITPPG